MESAPKTLPLTSQEPCPCQSGHRFGSCCEPFLRGLSHAGSPEELLRSRYTAYAVNDIDYLLATLAPEHHGAFNVEDVRRWNRDTQWLALHVLDSAVRGDTGTARFHARFRHQGILGDMREDSQFEFRAGRWFYLDGTSWEAPPQPARSPGRNDPCPCGSGRKYKKCCGKPV